MAHVVGRDEDVAGVVGLVGEVALQFAARREHRRFAGAEFLAAHLVRLEIVADVLADPGHIPRLDAHVAIGHHLARRPVYRRIVRHERGGAVLDKNIRAGRVGRREVPRDPAFGRTRYDLLLPFHHPTLLLLRPNDDGKKGGQKNEQEDGGHSCHSTRPIKQNPYMLPSSYSSESVSPEASRAPWRTCKT